jgi:hypothetical protein
MSTFLKIEISKRKNSIVLILSGRIEAEDLEELQRLLDSEQGAKRVALNLRDIQLVSKEVVQFLARCEQEGLLLEHCPAYIVEWIRQERQDLTTAEVKRH